MQQKSRRLTKIISVLGVLALAGLGMRAGTADEVFDWNVTGFEATAEGGQNAVHDALNAVERRYEPYLYEGRAEPGAAPAAAIAAAARDVLVEVIPAWGKPEQREKALGIVDSAYASALAKVPDGLAKGTLGCSPWSMPRSLTAISPEPTRATSTTSGAQ